MQKADAAPNTRTNKHKTNAPHTTIIANINVTLPSTSELSVPSQHKIQEKPREKTSRIRNEKSYIKCPFVTMSTKQHRLSTHDLTR